MPPKKPLINPPDPSSNPITKSYSATFQTRAMTSSLARGGNQTNPSPMHSAASITQSNQSKQGKQSDLSDEEINTSQIFDSDTEIMSDDEPINQSIHSMNRVTNPVSKLAAKKPNRETLPLQPVDHPETTNNQDEMLAQNARDKYNALQNQMMSKEAHITVPTAEQSTNQSIEQPVNCPPSPDIIAQTPPQSPMRRHQSNANPSDNDAKENDDDGLSTNMAHQSNNSINQSMTNPSIKQSRSNVTNTDTPPLKLRARTNTISADMAAEKGCTLERNSLSFILTISASDNEGQRFIDGGRAMMSSKPAIRKILLAKYLHTIISSPIIPLSIVTTNEDQVKPKLKELENACSDKAEACELLSWITAINQSFSGPLDQAIREDYPVVSKVLTTSNEMNIPVTNDWAQLINENSFIILSENKDGTKANIIRLLLSFNNTVVCNLAIAQLNVYVKTKSSQAINQIYVSEKAKLMQQASSPVSDGFKLITGRNQYTSAQTVLTQLIQPIIPSFDSIDHGISHITKMPSLMYSINVGVEPVKPRFVTVKFSGFPTNNNKHPIAARLSNIKDVSQISDLIALQSLKEYMLWHPNLQTSATSITLPSSTHSNNKNNGVCFITTPKSNIKFVNQTIQHWKQNQPKINPADNWSLNINIELPKDGIRLCTYCNAPGHNQTHCPSLKVSNSTVRDANNKPIPLCSRCHQQDIPAHACIAISTVICLICNNSGHSSKECQYSKKSWAQVAGSLKRNPNQKRNIDYQPNNKPNIRPVHYTNPPSTQQQAPASQNRQPLPQSDLLTQMRTEQAEFMKAMQQSFNQSIVAMQTQMQQMQTQMMQHMQQMLQTLMPTNQSINQPINIQHQQQSCPPMSAPAQPIICSANIHPNTLPRTSSLAPMATSALNGTSQSTNIPGTLTSTTQIPAQPPQSSGDMERLLSSILSNPQTVALLYSKLTALQTSAHQLTHING